MREPWPTSAGRAPLRQAAWRRYRWAVVPAAAALLITAGYLIVAHRSAVQARFADAASGPPPASAAAAPTSSPSAGPSPSASSHTPLPAGPGLHGCPNLPATNVWHADVSHLPVLPASGTYVASI